MSLPKWIGSITRTVDNWGVSVSATEDGVRVDADPASKDERLDPGGARALAALIAQAAEESERMKKAVLP